MISQIECENVTYNYLPTKKVHSICHRVPSGKMITNKLAATFLPTIKSPIIFVNNNKKARDNKHWRNHLRFTKLWSLYRELIFLGFEQNLLLMFCSNKSRWDQLYKTIKLTIHVFILHECLSNWMEWSLGTCYHVSIWRSVIISWWLIA